MVWRRGRLGVLGSESLNRYGRYCRIRARFERDFKLLLAWICNELANTNISERIGPLFALAEAFAVRVAEDVGEVHHVLGADLETGTRQYRHFMILVPG